MFAALCVNELGNKSINFSLALPSSKDCIRLGSSGIKPIKKGKNIVLRSESKIQLEDSPLWKLTDLSN